ncbi:anthrax toxin-like adenylyl cyclase domain-containing protein [Rahnella inusitata]|uniref:anthrax toxin-like adenylyl cyclase domain-containing protein n=1 Tax=Rahnella inusitata TaxID=58169 RepID=UPI0039BEC450
MHLIPINCGITKNHIDKINKISREYSCFIFIRPVNLYSTSLIEEDYRTKKLDIHAKSSDWGPMAGFICVDSTLSKLAGGNPEKIARNANDVRKSLNTPGVGKTHLVISKKRVDELINKKLFTLENDTHEFTATKPNASAVRFQFEQRGDKYAVFYWPMATNTKTPLFVIGYTVNNVTTAATADYDLFAIAPHFSANNFETKTVTRVSDHGMRGVLSLFQLGIMKEINRRCGYPPVVNHGTELNNPFPENDTELAMFCPGGTSRMIRTRDVQHIFGDLALKGFHVYANQRWNAAVQAHIGAKLSRLSRPAVISTCVSSYLKQEDFGGLRIKGYGGETNDILAARSFYEDILNNSSASPYPRWR